MWTKIKREAYRPLGLIAIGALLIMAATPMAKVLGEPAISPWGLFLGGSFIALAFTFVMRRILFPHIDLQKYARVAIEEPIGAGIVFLGVCVVLAAIFLTMGSAVRADELPANARALLPLLKAEQVAHWPGIPLPSALASQVEQETCISLKSRGCWNPRTELKTSREYGFGLGQLTITSRFNAFEEVRALDPSLRDWQFSDRYDPGRQLRALVLKDLQGWRVIQGARSDPDRLAFAFAAYNGGNGGVLSDRRVCAATTGCDQGRWFGNVERTSLKQKTAAGGYGQSFFQINRGYVAAILITRRLKYVEAMS